MKNTNAKTLNVIIKIKEVNFSIFSSLLEAVSSQIDVEILDKKIDNQNKANYFSDYYTIKEHVI